MIHSPDVQGFRHGRPPPEQCPPRPAAPGGLPPGAGRVAAAPGDEHPGRRGRPAGGARPPTRTPSSRTPATRPRPASTTGWSIKEYIYPLKVGINTVGRSPDNDVVVQDCYISRRHCAILVHTGERLRAARHRVEERHLHQRQEDRRPHPPPLRRRNPHLRPAARLRRPLRPPRATSPRRTPSPGSRLRSDDTPTSTAPAGVRGSALTIVFASGCFDSSARGCVA